jgi:shikimate kinase
MCGGWVAPVRVLAAAFHWDALLQLNETRQFDNIALVGFMGAGKSTVGQMLAQQLHFEFADTDRIIEQREGRKVAEVFATKGEPYFRSVESEVAHEFEGRRGLVISTGGGLVVNPANLEALRRHSLIVCLWASPEVIYERVRNQSHRPLLQAPDPLTKIRELLQSRRSAYMSADVIIGVDYRTPAETARQIASSFRRAASDEPPVQSGRKG